MGVIQPGLKDSRSKFGVTTFLLGVVSRCQPLLRLNTRLMFCPHLTWLPRFLDVSSSDVVIYSCLDTYLLHFEVLHLLSWSSDFSRISNVSKCLLSTTVVGLTSLKHYVRYNPSGVLPVRNHHPDLIGLLFVMRPGRYCFECSSRFSNLTRRSLLMYCLVF